MIVVSIIALTMAILSLIIQVLTWRKVKATTEYNAEIQRNKARFDINNDPVKKNGPSK